MWVCWAGWPEGGARADRHDALRRTRRAAPGRAPCRALSACLTLVGVVENDPAATTCQDDWTAVHGGGPGWTALGYALSHGPACSACSAHPRRVPAPS